MWYSDTHTHTRTTSMLVSETIRPQLPSPMCNTIYTTYICTAPSRHNVCTNMNMKRHHIRCVFHSMPLVLRIIIYQSLCLRITQTHKQPTRKSSKKKIESKSTQQERPSTVTIIWIYVYKYKYAITHLNKPISFRAA